MAQKKGDITGEIEQAQKALTLMGGALREIKPVEIEGLADQRCLVVIDKVGNTPASYPRRPGMPEKRPLLA